MYQISPLQLKKKKIKKQNLVDVFNHVSYVVVYKMYM